MQRVLRLVMITVFALCVSRVSHAAGGINLSWDDCGTFGSMAKTFGCDTNTGVNTLIASAIPPAPMPQFVAMAATILLAADQPTLPSWWNFDVGCRASPTSAMETDFNFVGGPFNCHDAWAGGAYGGFNYESGFSGPNRARFRMVCAVPSNAPAPLDGVAENYLFRVSITNAKTVGPGSCGGCDVGMCVVLASVELDDPHGAVYILSNPLSRQFVVWQGGASVSGGCPQATPTRNTTWGAV